MAKPHQISNNKIIKLLREYLREVPQEREIIVAAQRKSWWSDRNMKIKWNKCMDNNLVKFTLMCCRRESIHQLLQRGLSIRISIKGIASQITGTKISQSIPNLILCLLINQKYVLLAEAKNLAFKGVRDFSEAVPLRLLVILAQQHTKYTFQLTGPRR